MHLDDDLHPAPVPPLLLETDEDRARYEEAAQRRAVHKAHRKAKKARAAEQSGS